MAESPSKKPKTVSRTTWDEFTCPECDANNPYGSGFEVGDEVFCCWCGCVFDVRRDVNDETRFKLKRQ